MKTDTAKPLSERYVSVLVRAEDLAPDAQILRISADGMPRFQIDNATQPITYDRVIREVLRWVENTHVPNISYRHERNLG